MFNLKMYMAGEWVDAENGETREIVNPATGEVIARAAEGTEEDAKKAIRAAREAFDSGSWSELAAAERARYLFAIADKLEERAEELAALETLDNGKPLREARFDVADAAACFRYYAGMVTKPDGQTYHVADPVQAMVVREAGRCLRTDRPVELPVADGCLENRPRAGGRKYDCLQAVRGHACYGDQAV